MAPLGKATVNNITSVMTKDGILPPIEVYTPYNGFYALWNKQLLTLPPFFLLLLACMVLLWGVDGTPCLL
ncbi:MAG: hypothetical protein WC776_05030 [Patescibacteria group bacterium]